MKKSVLRPPENSCHRHRQACSLVLGQEGGSFKSLPTDGARACRSIILDRRLVRKEGQVVDQGIMKLDGVHPVDNRPSTNKSHHFVQKEEKKEKKKTPDM